MVEVEEQIRRLADAAYDATTPVAFDPVASQRRTRLRPVAFAAAAVIAIGLAGLVTAVELRADDDAAAERFSIDDPLNVDLDEAIARSEQARIGSVGPQLTFAYGQLPDAWETSVRFTITTPRREHGAEYWQQVQVGTPGGSDLVLNVTGTLDPDVEPRMSSIDESADTVDIRGQDGRLTGSGLTWIEQGRAIVEIVRGPSPAGANVESDMVELARRLQPVTTQLDWGNEPITGRPAPDSTPLFAGTLAGTRWELVRLRSGLALAIGTDRISRSEGQPPTERGDQVGFSIEPVDIPGGTVVYGDAPLAVSQVALRTTNSVTTIPTQAFDGRVAFAVPVDDRLDPIGVDLLDADGQLLGTIPLQDQPPYVGGGQTSGVSL